MIGHMYYMYTSGEKIKNLNMGFNIETAAY